MRKKTAIDPTAKPLLRVSAAASALHVTLQTVRNMIADGRLDAVHLNNPLRQHKRVITASLIRHLIQPK